MGSSDVGEREITRRISLVAVCCSRASMSSRWRSAYDDAGEGFPSGRRKGVLQFRQKWACDGFSCWHRGHFMPKPPGSRVGEGSDRDYPPETGVVKNINTCRPSRPSGKLFVSNPSIGEDVCGMGVG